MLGRLKFDLEELANEMLDQLPVSVFKSKTTTFLDPCMGGGQFVKAIEARLRKYGHGDANIAKRIFGVESSKLRLNYAVDKYALVGKYYVCENYLEYNETMKFDVVIGNPPYQDASNDKRMLWNQFLDKSIEVCAEGGYIAMVTPATWLRGQTNIHNSYRLFETLEVEYAKVYAYGDTPFEVGSTVSYHITKNSAKEHVTPVYYEEWSKRNGQFVANVDLENEKLWPGEFTLAALVWHKKFAKHQKLVFEKSCEFHNQGLKKKGRVSDIKTKKFPYTHHVSAAITRYTSVKFSRHNEWKVMVPLTSTIDKAVVDNNCGHGEDMLTLYTNSKAEADRIKCVFQSKLYKFIGKLYKSGRNQILQNIFPVIDFSRAWTDEELYKHFKLTKKEIEYIENAIK